jgi:hypothetical protein
MPIVIFINKEGQFEKTIIRIQQVGGKAFLLDDVNGDGNPDILAGNWGWNNKLWSGKMVR